MMTRNIHKAIIALLLVGLPSITFAKRYDVALPEVASYLKTAQPGDRIKFVYHTIRQTTVISQFLSVTEFYYGTFGSISVSEMQSADR